MVTLQKWRVQFEINVAYFLFLYANNRALKSAVISRF